ncbi:hypothetical protein BC937DRAFT_86463 [Endogone sp. FLAS-F59071]|nr:hypothetical protein BC937DRAFT_86463 [Endogone sp. FLAS-F59071]|eukprot:RUS20065.1 hypothetical protein BC937DRAFT_86463 [Endogone sp. FLAS-F59071]
MARPDIDSYHDFTLFETIEVSTHASSNPSSLFSDKDEIFLQQATGLLDTIQQESTRANSHTSNDQIFYFDFDTIALTSFPESPFTTPTESPLINTQSTPYFTPFESPYEEFEQDSFETPFETPFEEFEQDPLLSPSITFNELEKDEGHGTTEFKHIYSPDILDGNPSTLLHIDFEATKYDPDEITGNLIKPLSSTSYMDEISSTPSTLDRKRKSSSLDTSEPVRRKHPGCDKAFAHLFMSKPLVPIFCS